jgi:hypothetical protein
LQLRKNETTVIVVTKDRTHFRQISITRKKVLIFIGSFIVLFLLVGDYTIDFLLNFRYDSKVEILERNNSFLKKQLDEMASKVEKLTGHRCEQRRRNSHDHGPERDGQGCA